MNTGFEQMKRAAFAAAVFVVAGVFAGNTLNVPSDYSTLETALAAAQDGDEIVLAADTYTTAALITVSDGITIRGATGNPADVVIKASGSFRVLSNRESGFGRFDIALFPLLEGFPGVIIEVKAAAADTDDLDALAAAARDQIEEKAYEADLRAQGVADILKFGLAFRGKRVSLASR